MNTSARPGTSRVLINVAIYQAGWFACVLSAARDRSGLGIAVAVLIVCGWLMSAPRPSALGQLIVLTGVVGYSWDSWLSVLGVIRYLPGPVSPPLAPLWILALWLLFSTTLHISLRWLQPKLWLAALLGALAAPLAYYGAARFGALTLPRVLPALGAQAAGWALLLPLLLRLSRRLDA
jgi:hypothetical protein